MHAAGQYFLRCSRLRTQLRATPSSSVPLKVNARVVIPFALQSCTSALRSALSPRLHGLLSNSPPHGAAQRGRAAAIAPYTGTVYSRLSPAHPSLEVVEVPLGIKARAAQSSDGFVPVCLPEELPKGE